jgi:HEAT repeat protein
MALDGASAVEDGLSALHDPEPSVRGAAARALGALGGSAVGGLRRTVDSSNADAARAAVVALQLTGSPEAAEVLGEIAESHRDESVRTLAAIALGRQVGHEH